MNEITSLVEKIFGNRGRRFLLFLFSYMLAVLISGIILGGGSIEQLIQYLILSPVGLILFPMGFGWPIFNFNYSREGITLIVGWLSYLIITVFAIAKNNRIAKILYLIFVILLILNIGGCTIGEMIVT